MIKILPEVSEFLIDDSLESEIGAGRCLDRTQLSNSSGMGSNLSVSKKVGPCFQMGLA